MVSLQQRLMAPACLHCRMSLPSSSVFSMALSVNASPALSSGHVSGYGVPVMSRPERCSLAVGRNDSNFFRGMCLTFSRNFAGRAQHRAATSARLASVEFTTEEAKIVDDVRETLDGVEVDPSKKLEGNMRRLAGSNIIMDMNMGRHHLVKSAEFIKSSPKESECPKDGLPEFALVGRSNVGKSSLINALVNRKELAQTSKRPGRHFTSLPLSASVEVHAM